MLMSWKGIRKHTLGEPTHETTVEYPPPTFNLIAALLVVAFAGPVWAQTITAPGLVGQPACAGTGEITDINFGTISAVGNTSAVFTYVNISNLYSILRSRSGDGGATVFPIRYRLYNNRTGAQVADNPPSTVIESGNPNFTAAPTTFSGLSARTPYYVVVYTTATGFGESRPFLRRCFMTGGTYTPSNESGQPGYVANTTSGCFSISPRTFQDIRNCLCGRSRVWNDDDQNTAQRRTLGCADAN